MLRANHTEPLPLPPPSAAAGSDGLALAFAVTAQGGTTLRLRLRGDRRQRRAATYYDLRFAAASVVLAVRGAAVARHDEKGGELLPPATATAFWLVVAGGCVRLGRGADPAAAATELLHWRDAAPTAAAAAALEAREPSQWRICRLAPSPIKC